MCGPRGDVGPKILDDAGLVCGRDVGADVIEGQRADGRGVECLEVGLKSQPISRP
jgi:hypothetical protein